ncbi:MAG: amidohydrolase, partial [Dehalococcoidia bacterium]
MLAAAFGLYAQRSSRAEPVVTTTLYSGWNMFAYVGPTQPVADALAQIEGKFNIVWSLDGSSQQWAGFDPSAPPFLNDLQQLEQFAAYMIFMNAQGELTFDVAKALPELVFHNGAILTMETDYPEVQAIAIRGEKIVAAGSDKEVLALRGPETRVIDLEGRTLLPGFNDSHAHWIGDRDFAGHPTAEEAMQAALENGWTSISELFVNRDRLDELWALDSDGRLRLRVNAYLPLNWQHDRFGNWYKAYEAGQEFSARLRVGGVKIFIDNADRGEKFLSEPYADNPGYYGEAFWTQEELNEVVAEAHQAGFQIAAHTGGDAAHDLILNAYENALQGESNEKYRHRIEHVMILRDDQLERMRRLGIIASFQVSFFHSDWAEEFGSNLGPERVGWVGRWRDLLEEGVPSIGSTDSPWGYGTVGPSMKAIYQAVTRIGEEGLPAAEWMLDQRISVEQALRLITADAAYGTFQEDVKGSVAVGKLADLVILSENPLTVPVERLLEIQVLMT